MSFLFRSMLAAVATAQFPVPGKKWMHPGPGSCLMPGEAVACLFILVMHSCFAGELVTKQTIAFELLTIAIGAVLINIDARVSFSLAPDSIKFRLPGTPGINRCKLVTTA